MKTDDWRTEDGGGGDQTESNVVRLPREWIGPIEELVPFGPSAGTAPSVSRRDADADLIPPGADDFWGEDSAAVQDALQAPSGTAVPHAPHATAVPHAPHAPSGADVPDALQARDGRTALRRPRIDRPFSFARGRSLRNAPGLRRPSRATAGVGVIVALALIVSVSESGPSANSNSNSNKDRVRAAVTLPASVEAPPSKRPLAASTKHVANHNPARRSQRNRRAEVHRAGKRVKHAAAQRSAPTHQTFVASSSPVTRPAPVQNAPGTGSSSPSASASSGTQSVVHSSASPGPTGTVSLIGSGTSPSG